LAGDFAKEFKNIEHEIAELQRRTASGEINLIDAKAAEKEIDKIEKRWAFLLNKVGGESFLEKGLKADAQAMAALESLAKSYAAGIKEAEQQETKLNKKLEEAK
jgi:chaperonin cofactor prefoldin